MRTAFIVRAAATAAACVFVFSACGGSSPGGGATIPTTTVSPTPAATTTPVVAASACERIGDGVVKAQCGRGGMTFYDAVDAAIEKLIRQRPELFNLDDAAGPGSYRVLEPDDYYLALGGALAEAGLCAQMDATKTFLQVKGNNDASENYRVLTSKGFIARGAWIYQDTCMPASFPVGAADTISYIRISFFGFNCAAGIKEPEKADRKLPMGCDGYLTATPKDPDGRDVPIQIHGGDVDWRFKRGEEFVGLRQWPSQPFNQTVYPVAPGFFKLCATVQGVSGCLGVEVVQ